MNNLPYIENKISHNKFIRTFNRDTKSSELIWHKDHEDRIIKVIKNKNWYIQLDNELPVLIKDDFFIPKETYHRLIKGDGDLKILIIETNNL